MDIKPIRNEADYEATLKEVERLWGSEPGTPDGDRFEILFTREEQPCLEGAVVFFDDDEGADTPSEEDAQHAIDCFRGTMQRLRRTTDIPIHHPRPYRHLSFRIAGPLPLDADFKQQLLSIRNETERLRQVLHTMDALIAHLDVLQKAQEKSRGNGDLHSKN